MSFLTALTGTPARNFQTDEMLWSCRQAKRWMMPSHRSIFTSLIVLSTQLSPCNTGASTTAGVSESCKNSWATFSMHGIHMPKPVFAWQTLLYEDNRTGYPKRKKAIWFSQDIFHTPMPNLLKFQSGITFLLPIQFPQPAVKQPDPNSPFPLAVSFSCGEKTTKQLLQN